MAKIRIKRKVLSALLTSVFITILLTITINVISIAFQIQMFRTLSFEDLKNRNSNQLYIILRHLTTTIYYILPIIGGYITGLKLKNNGWKYGALFGVTLYILNQIIYLVFIGYIYIKTSGYPVEIRMQILQQTFQFTTIFQYIFSLSKGFILMVTRGALGGLLADYFHKKNTKNIN